MEMEMIVGRTPLKARNQTFTPALGLLNITITFHIMYGCMPPIMCMFFSASLMLTMIDLESRRLC